MLPTKMLALVAHGISDYRVEEIDTPTATGGEVILKVEACGWCAGDVSCYEGGPRFWGGAGDPPYCEPPFIPGHEIVGEIVEVGPKYYGKLRTGARVVVEQIVPCGKCKYCKAGKYTLCVDHMVFGFKGRLNGGCSEFMLVPERAIMHAVPDVLKPEQAVLIEPFACAIHAVDRAEIQKGDVVVIAGCGTLGLGMIAAAKLFEPKAIVAIDPVSWLRDKGVRQGATHTMDMWRGMELPPLISELTDGYGCDVYIDATGSPSGVTQGLRMIGKGGRFVEFSVFNEPTTVDWSIIGDVKEIDIRGSSLSPNCFERAIRAMVDETMETFGVVTHSLPLCMYRHAIDVARGREGIKTMLKPPLDRLFSPSFSTRFHNPPTSFYGEDESDNPFILPPSISFEDPSLPDGLRTDSPEVNELNWKNERLRVEKMINDRIKGSPKRPKKPK